MNSKVLLYGGAFFIPLNIYDPILLIYHISDSKNGNMVLGRSRKSFVNANAVSSPHCLIAKGPQICGRGGG
jgi:hypothetical protein